MSYGKVASEENHLIKQNTEAASFLSKQNIVIKHNRSIKIKHIELSPYVHQQFGFIDPDFAHTDSSINQNQFSPTQPIEWLPAQLLLPRTNYSDMIASLDQVLFYKKPLGLALILINWFAKDIFNQLFLKELSPIHLYGYNLMVDGVFLHVPIDSYVPVDPTSKREIYTQNYKGSIFPCLYQKLMAKVYGDYYSISSQFIDLVQLSTLFCRQEVSITQGIIQPDLLKIIAKKLSEKSIVSFRTRNSIRLQSFGLESNHIYIIVKLIHKAEESIIEFLELEGQNWIGKHSKLRSNWILEDKQFINRNKVILSEEYKQNYMSVKDMKGISRELVILNNTFEYHKNYYVCQHTDYCFSMHTFIIDQNNQVMLKTNFKHKNCYNTLMLLQKFKVSTAKQPSTIHYKLLDSSFHQHKSSNYIEASLSPGEYVIIVYNTHPQQNILPYNLTLFSSDTFINIVSSFNPVDILGVLQIAFRDYFLKSYKNSIQPVVLKHLYDSTGLAFIFIKPNSYPIEITIRLDIFRQFKIIGLNIEPKEKENTFLRQFKVGQTSLLIFRCHWSKKENIVFQYQMIQSNKHIQKLSFPPIGSMKVTQKKFK